MTARLMVQVKHRRGEPYLKVRPKSTRIHLERGLYSLTYPKDLGVPFGVLIRLDGKKALETCLWAIPVYGEGDDPRDFMRVDYDFGRVPRYTAYVRSLGAGQISIGVLRYPTVRTVDAARRLEARLAKADFSVDVVFADLPRPN